MTSKGRGNWLEIPYPMLFYHRMGKVPPKRHIQFRKPDGSLYAEQLFSTRGFDGPYSLIYHHHPPTKVIKIDPPREFCPEIAVDVNMQHRAFRTFQIEGADDFLESRVPLLTNSDITISVVVPRRSMTDYFFKNADADELYFVHRGRGVLKTFLGNLPFREGDYLVVPRGTIYQFEFDTDDVRMLLIEAYQGAFTFPERYRNEVGQLLEHSPIYERDIRVPEELETYDRKGDFLVYILRGGKLWGYHLLYHPFDVVGWDGYWYPIALSIHDFMPIVGKVHQPPPVHQTFDAPGFVVCSFVPRLYDWHELAIPAPYNHSNIDYDEILYYVAGEFMSRKHVEEGMITLHPRGIPHGPHPGAVERSIGAKETNELAVMIDTWNPLSITRQALAVEVKDYYLSWLTDEERPSDSA